MKKLSNQKQQMNLEIPKKSYHKKEPISPLTPKRNLNASNPFYISQADSYNKHTSKSSPESPKTEKNTQFRSNFINLNETNQRNEVVMQNIEIQIPETRSKEECSLTYTTSIGSRKRPSNIIEINQTTENLEIEEKIAYLKNFLKRREEENKVSNVIFLQDIEPRDIFESMRVEEREFQKRGKF